MSEAPDYVFVTKEPDDISAQILGELDVFYTTEGLVESLRANAVKYIRADLHDAELSALREERDKLKAVLWKWEELVSRDLKQHPVKHDANRTMDFHEGLTETRAALNTGEEG